MLDSSVAVGGKDDEEKKFGWWGYCFSVVVLCRGTRRA